MTVTPETLRKLAQYDTPTICNVIELFDVRPRTEGYMDHRVQCAFPELPPIVGFAATASFRAGHPAAGVHAYATLQEQIEAFEELPGPPIVVIQDLDNPPVAAAFGEVMCSSYRAFGSVGVITNGAGRDMEQIRALKFPLFTCGAIASHGYCHWMHLGAPVRVAGLAVQQGDLLHADANGVTNIPLDIALEVADAAAEFIKAEEHVLSYNKSDGPKSLAEWREQDAATSAAIGALRKKFSRHRA